MTAYIATPATRDAIWAKVQAGDTLILDGQFDGWRPSNKSFSTPLIIDATKARISDFYGKNLEGITWIGAELAPGAKWNTGIRIDSAKRQTFRKTRIVGTDPSRGLGALWINTGSDILIEDISADQVHTALAFNDVVGLQLRRAKISGVGSDGIDLYGVQNAVVEDIEGRDFKPVTGAHPDLIQMSSFKPDPARPGYHLKNKNIAVRRVTGSFIGQGVFAGSAPGYAAGEPQAGHENILIEDSDLELGYPNGICIVNGVGCTIRNNRLRTLPGSQWQSVIRIDNCPDIVRSGNYVAGYAAPDGRIHKPIIDADYVESSPSASVVPETIEITLKPGQKLVVRA